MNHEAELVEVALGGLPCGVCKDLIDVEDLRSLRAPGSTRLPFRCHRCQTCIRTELKIPWGQNFKCDRCGKDQDYSKVVDLPRGKFRCVTCDDEEYRRAPED